MLLAVDPGVDFGWALFNPSRARQRALKTEAYVPIGTGIVRTKHDDEEDQFDRWLTRTDDAERQLTDILIEHEVKRCVCEWPAYMSDSEAGIAAAGKGDLVKLAFMVGRIASACNQVSVVFKAVRVIDWKGQLPKRVVNQRIERLLGKRNCAKFKDHVWDAVGIGLYDLGRFG